MAGLFSILSTALTVTACLTAIIGVLVCIYLIGARFAFPLGALAASCIVPMLNNNEVEVRYPGSGSPGSLGTSSTSTAAYISVTSLGGSEVENSSGSSTTSDGARDGAGIGDGTKWEQVVYFDQLARILAIILAYFLFIIFYILETTAAMQMDKQAGARAAKWDVRRIAGIVVRMEVETVVAVGLLRGVVWVVRRGLRYMGV